MAPGSGARPSGRRDSPSPDSSAPLRARLLCAAPRSPLLRRSTPASVAPLRARLRCAPPTPASAESRLPLLHCLSYRTCVQPTFLACDGLYFSVIRTFDRGAAIAAWLARTGGGLSRCVASCRATFSAPSPVVSAARLRVRAAPALVYSHCSLDVGSGLVSPAWRLHFIYVLEWRHTKMTRTQPLPDRSPAARGPARRGAVTWPPRRGIGTWESRDAIRPSTPALPGRSPGRVPSRRLPSPSLAARFPRETPGWPSCRVPSWAPSAPRA